MTRPTRPTDADTFGDLHSPDEYAANGYRLKPVSRFEQETAAWRNRGNSAARTAIAVTDTAEVRARGLLVGGVWIDGPFRPVWSAPTAGHQLGWISDGGVYVTVHDVQARDLAGAHGSDWRTYLTSEPAEDCPGSLALALRPNPEGKRDDDGYVIDVPAEVGTEAYCPDCDRSLPVITPAGAVEGLEREPVLAEHDRRGRRIEAGHTVYA